jgi:hypothetical protein
MVTPPPLTVVYLYRNAVSLVLRPSRCPAGLIPRPCRCPSPPLLGRHSVDILGRAAAIPWSSMVELNLGK